jgi:hypothetical protein
MTGRASRVENVPMNQVTNRFTDRTPPSPHTHTHTHTHTRARARALAGEQGRQCSLHVNLSAFAQPLCRGKGLSTTYSECVSVVFVIQQATRMRRTILSSVACAAVPCFPTLSHRRHDFVKKKKHYCRENVL